ncbi:endonuclease V [Stratiformator vulcanicus]|uniref:Endonuclease V n=1 Tax=Stratiformator vulcanicus TaxID=2527980 RepID=A0A517QVN5_9PLAN|nr:endonuclease V [Stratiformator vulcanicus]QDT35716.1 Endonuclease V [Stratiformator vulcanicus]
MTTSSPQFHEPPDLKAELAKLLRQIPPGQVTTFGDLARALGDIKAAKWIASALPEPSPTELPESRRVVRQTGEISPAGGTDPAQRIEQLRSAGVPMRDNRVRLDECRFRDFASAQPLRQLARQQELVRPKVSIESMPEMPDVVAGIDVSYQSDGTAVAAYVEMAADSSEPLCVVTAKVPAPLPYITGYLAFREIPAHLAAIKKARQRGDLAPLLLVDGNGILHPRRCGVASQLGVVLDHPTVGVGKKLLCGKVGSEGTITDAEGEIGRIVKPTPASKPLYVSPGHCCDLADATAVVRKFFRGHRLPEPLYLADRLSRKVARESSS